MLVKHPDIAPIKGGGQQLYPVLSHHMAQPSGLNKMSPAGIDIHHAPAA
jgi:hypothetical protein